MRTQNLTWQPVAGTQNFQTDNGWRAVFASSYKGHVAYRVYQPDGKLYGMGGLPPFVVLR